MPDGSKGSGKHHAVADFGEAPLTLIDEMGGPEWVHDVGEAIESEILEEWARLTGDRFREASGSWTDAELAAMSDLHVSHVMKFRRAAEHPEYILRTDPEYVQQFANVVDVPVDRPDAQDTEFAVMCRLVEEMSTPQLNTRIRSRLNDDSLSRVRRAVRVLGAVQHAQLREHELWKSWASTIVNDATCFHLPSDNGAFAPQREELCEFVRRTGYWSAVREHRPAFIKELGRAVCTLEKRALKNKDMEFARQLQALGAGIKEIRKIQIAFTEVKGSLEKAAWRLRPKARESWLWSKLDDLQLNPMSFQDKYTGTGWLIMESRHGQLAAEVLRQTPP